MRSLDGRECSTFVQHKIIVVTGRRTSTLYLCNPNERRVEKVEVDGCAITEGPRCDWLVLLNDAISREEIYAELKGSGVYHAADQLQATIERLSVDRVRIPKRCFVVFTRNPMTGTDVQRYKAKFRRNFNSRFDLVRDKAKITL